MMEVKKYYEPREILNTMKSKESEMNAEQHAFLCGLMREKRPKKIVEVGVAAGGTTCVLLNCINKLCEGKLVSVDLSEKYWRDETKRTGYMLEELPDELKKDHKLLTGKYLAERLEEIAPERDIDFLVLDTVHSLPGEMFDFIAAFPYLKKDAIVVLHDIVLNHLGGDSERYATKVVLDTVTARKYYLFGTDTNECKRTGMENIAAFQINEDTAKYISDCFSALSITWSYVPEESELDIYRKLVEKEYDSLCLKLWDCAVKMQTVTKEEKYIYRDMRGGLVLPRLQQKWTSAKKVCIYGFTMKGKIYFAYALKHGYRVDAIVVSDDAVKPVVANDNIPVYTISEVPFSKKECAFINAGEREESIRAIRKNIYEAGFSDIINEV